MDSRERFSDRAADYVRFRPTYPSGVKERLRGLGSRAADVGSGTGISSELLLSAGLEVFAVEPNAAMRAEAERLLGGRAGFHPVAGSAEHTTLAAGSVDLVLAAQAFHWFDLKAAKAEFRRILGVGGSVAVLFNDRDANTSLGRAYEALLLEFGNDYANVRHRNVGPERFSEFLGEYEEFRFPNSQLLDFEGLVGRVCSSSYAPKVGESAYAPMVARLRELFGEHQRDGMVELAYVTHLLIARW